MEQLVCRNCQGAFSGNFCPQCGQKHVTIPYSFRSIGQLAVSNLDFNRGFFFTFAFLLWNPGKVTTTYLGGNTRKFTDPGRYFVSVFTLAAIGLFLKTYFWSSALQLDSNTHQAAPEIADALVTSLEPFLVSIPWMVTVAIMNYLLFRSARNAVEHLIIALYFVLQLVLVALLLWPLFFMVGSSIFSLMLMYMLWFNFNVFKGHWVVSIAKSLASLAVQMALIFGVGRVLFGLT